MSSGKLGNARRKPILLQKQAGKNFAPGVRTLYWYTDKVEMTMPSTSMEVGVSTKDFPQGTLSSRT